MLRRRFVGPSDDELLDDDLVRQIVEEMDPMRGVPVPPAPEPLVPLRGRADRRAGTPRWLLVPVGVGAVVLAVVAATGVLRGGDTAPPTPPAADRLAVPAPLALPRADNPPPAREYLRTLFERAAVRPDPGTSGRYSYVRTQTWSIETTPAPPGEEQLLVARDEQLWWAADRSGRAVVTTLPPQPSGTVRTAYPADLPAGGAVQTVDYKAGELAVVLSTPASEAAILAGQLSAHQPFTNGPQSPLRAVVDMHQFHVLNPAQQAAGLRVLVDTDGLRYRGEVVDRAGRPGVAISVDSDSGATRDVAVFDANSGDLLSYERVALLDPSRPRLRTPAVVSYVLFLARGVTDQLGQPVDR